MSTLPLLARQPIFNQKLEVIGYELLNRNPSFDLSSTAGQDSATGDVLLNAFTELPISEVVGKHYAFINFSKRLLKEPLAFPRQQLVIEVLEGQKIDSAMLHSLKVLREQGYIIALDDFTLTDETECLLAYADIVKLDVIALSPEKLKYHVDELSVYGIELLAEKIETYEVFEHCKNLGFHYFQGYFLSRPEIIHGKKLTENRQSLLQLLSVLHDPNAPVDKIELLIASDALLSFKLLRLINSAAMSLEREVDSLRQAILLLGINRLRTWINLLALSNLGGKPQELSILALTRARTCELLGNRVANKTEREAVHADGFFTVGLLSTLDAFLDMSSIEIVENLAIRQSLKEALLGKDNIEGTILKLVKSHEQGEWSLIDWPAVNQLSLTPEMVTEDYIAAISWVNEIMDGVSKHL